MPHAVGCSKDWISVECLRGLPSFLGGLSVEPNTAMLPAAPLAASRLWLALPNAAILARPLGSVVPIARQGGPDLRDIERVRTCSAVP